MKTTGMRPLDSCSFLIVYVMMMMMNYFFNVLINYSHVGNTALHLAILYRNPAMIQFLLLHGASLTLVNNNSQTPMELALHLNNSEVLDALKAVSKKPMPPGTPKVFKCLDGMMVSRWEMPMTQAGVPVPVLYEVEVVKETGAHEVLTSSATDCSKFMNMNMNMNMILKFVRK